MCASFISPVFELPAVKTASSYLLPALFGSMALGLFASSASGSKVVKGGILTSYVLWKKGKIQVVDKEQK